MYKKRGIQDREKKIITKHYVLFRKHILYDSEKNSVLADADLFQLRPVVLQNKLFFHRFTFIYS